MPPLALARVAVTALLAGCAVANVDADANAPPCGRVGLPCCDDAMGLGACAAPLTCGPDRVCAAKPDGAASDDASDAPAGDDASDAPAAPDGPPVEDAPLVDAEPDRAAPLDVAPTDAPGPTDAAVPMDVCAAPRGVCGGQCVDLAASALHCGACGRACPVAQQCSGGRCAACGALGQPTCAAGGCLSGLVACGGTCRDAALDAQHCGACGRACAMGMRCEAGACRAASGVFVTTGCSFARNADGGFRAWGTNAGAQLGDGSTTARLTPSVTMVPTGAEEVVGGTQHTCARLADGSVSCWGSGNVGQLGTGAASATVRPTPAPVPGLSGVTSIAAGASHTCAVRGDGTVACWGGNHAMQLGTGDTANRPAPASVVGLSGTFLAVAAGYNHTCARRADGAVYCWGLNTSGQLGNGGTSGAGPSAVPGLVAAEVSAGYLNTCARLADGSVRCWGQNSYGQVGDGSSTTRPSPVTVRTAAPALEVRVGAAFACARLMTQAVQCWGYNTNGGVGDGSGAHRATPTPVTGLTDATSLALSNSSHACARVASGGVRCWGYNRQGQVGDGSSTNRLAPVAVPGL